MTDLFNYHRRQSGTANVGLTPLGGQQPIRVQSMTTTSTNDIEGSVAQAVRIIEAGADYVRLTTQGVREAESLNLISQQLRGKGHLTPLVADVHFNPDVADVAARYVEKVRINPGNYVDPARKFRQLEYTDEEYAAELRKIEQRLIPFLNICKENHTAVRIGVNHGSLSDRIMSRYGDTPEGIVESCMEFLRICKRESFTDVVISIKASNTVVMVRSVRLLVHQMEQEGMDYPLHLGVTEAGEGEDGRIKSAVGIGALLADGIGDTIRVSLSEEPEEEIPVARHLVDYVTRRVRQLEITMQPAPAFDWLRPERRKTHAVGIIGGDHVPVVIGSDDIRMSDYKFVKIPLLLANDEFLSYLRQHPEIVVVTVGNTPQEHRAVIHRLMSMGITNPVVVSYTYHHMKAEKADFQLEAAADLGPLMIDGLCDGVWLMNEGDISGADIVDTSFAILQAARLRITKTEYISCPGCGRTLYDLRTTIARIKEATKDMTGLKIGIMGCIVNGPGEMADADYGYVGAGRGRISLYRRKECVERNIPEENAVERLLELIRQDGVRVGVSSQCR